MKRTKADWFKPLEVLLIFKKSQYESTVLLALAEHYKDHINVTKVEDLQEAVELLESNGKSFPLIVFEQRGSSSALIKMLLGLETQSVLLVCGLEESDSQRYSDYKERVEFCTAASVTTAIQSFERKEFLPTYAYGDEDFVPFQSQSLSAVSPIAADVFVRIDVGFFLRIAKRGDRLDLQEVKEIEKVAGGPLSFFKRTDAEVVLADQARKVTQLIQDPNVTAEKAGESVQAATQLVRDLIDRIGFTKEAQAIAKASVEMTLKLIGSKPKLKMILNDLRKKEGPYLTSHSIQLGRISCAIAHQVGWSSAATFFKLSMAGFLHDISLNDERLSRVRRYQQAAESGMFSMEELRQLRGHPVKAAEYARQFTEIPSDVEQIVAQHHERSDGQGFPRELSGKQIAPLAALFIIAHDLLDFFEKNGSASSEDFYQLMEAEYQQGNFKRIFLALKNGTTLT